MGGWGAVGWGRVVHMIRTQRNGRVGKGRVGWGGVGLGRVGGVG